MSKFLSLNVFIVMMVVSSLSAASSSIPKSTVGRSEASHQCLVALKEVVKMLRQEVRACVEQVLSESGIDPEEKTREELDALLGDEIKEKLNACQSIFPTAEDIKFERNKCRSL